MFNLTFSSGNSSSISITGATPLGLHTGVAASLQNGTILVLTPLGSSKIDVSCALNNPAYTELHLPVVVPLESFVGQTSWTATGPLPNQLSPRPNMGFPHTRPTLILSLPSPIKLQSW